MSVATFFGMRHFWENAGGPPAATGAVANFRGVDVLQIYEKLDLAVYYTTWEAQYNVGPALLYSKDHWEVPLVAVAAYIVLITVGPKVMESRAAFDLSLPLAVWNFALAVFSTCAAIRVVPELLYNVYNESWEATICMEPHHGWGVGATGLWVQLFIFSKLPELFDTVFIVLRKRELIFLHWYHHITVLLYCWHAYVMECGAGLYFVGMNCVVHAVMYTYFAAASLHIVPRWFPTIIITVMQIAQMFVGMFVCLSSIKYTYERHGSDTPCANERTNLVLASVMYLSYLALFLQFAVGKYLSGGKKKTE